MSSSEILTTLFLSLRVGLLATAVNLPLAVLISWFLSRSDFRAKSLVEGVINLPLVMPPVTTGYLLLMILGRRGVIGAPLFSHFGVSLAFTTGAAVTASMVVSFPLMARSVRISMDMADQRLERVAQTLGANRWQVLRRVTLPQILPGLLNGMVLGFARSLGEFGATMTFAGNIQGETRTIPLDVYSKLQIPGRERDAAILVGLSVIVSFAALTISIHFEKGLKNRTRRGLSPRKKENPRSALRVIKSPIKEDHHVAAV